MKGKTSRYQRQLSLFLAPYLLGSFFLILLPALATLMIAFTEYRGIITPIWNGLTNFHQLFVSQIIRTSFRTTLLFIIIAVPVRLLGALLLALLLNGRNRFFGFYRAAVYLPTIIPEAAYALIWLWIFNPLYGPLNLLLSKAGLPTVNWLVEAGPAQAAIVLMLAFQLGEGFIIALIALQSIPKAFYEAATIDGATAWQRFSHITLPLIAPWLLLLTLRDIVISVQATFTPSYMLTYGGPYYATTYLPLLVYELAFDFLDFGVAAAVLVIAYLIVTFTASAALDLFKLIHRGDV